MLKKYIFGVLIMCSLSVMPVTATQIEENNIKTENEQMEELQTISENIVMGHEFTELDDNAINALIMLTISDDKEAYINVNADSKSKIVYGGEVNVTSYNGKPGTIRFVDQNRKVLYAYKFINYKCDDELKIDLGMNIVESSGQLKITFDKEQKLPQNVSITVKVSKANTLYYVFNKNKKKVSSAKSSKNGYFTFRTKDLKNIILYTEEIK